MMRYIKMLENKDLSLNTSMISLGSCTMKLNAAAEMMPLSWSHWSRIHPFAPAGQAMGYKQIIDELSDTYARSRPLTPAAFNPIAGHRANMLVCWL
jgi:glycine dehydrogenase